MRFEFDAFPQKDKFVLMWLWCVTQTLNRDLRALKQVARGKDGD